MSVLKRLLLLAHSVSAAAAAAAAWNSSQLLPYAPDVVRRDASNNYASILYQNYNYVRPGQCRSVHDVPGKAVWCCNGSCLDGTHLGQAGGLCQDWFDVCKDPVNSACDGNSILLGSNQVNIDAGKGKCYEWCDWTKWAWEWNCCACDEGTLAIGTCDPLQPYHAGRCLVCADPCAKMVFNKNVNDYICDDGTHRKAACDMVNANADSVSRLSQTAAVLGALCPDGVDSPTGLIGNLNVLFQEGSTLAGVISGTETFTGAGDAYARAIERASWAGSDLGLHYGAATLGDEIWSSFCQAKSAVNSLLDTLNQIPHSQDRCAAPQDPPSCDSSSPDSSSPNPPPSSPSADASAPSETAADSDGSTSSDDPEPANDASASVSSRKHRRNLLERLEQFGKRRNEGNGPNGSESSDPSDSESASAGDEDSGSGNRRSSSGGGDYSTYGTTGDNPCQDLSDAFAGIDLQAGHGISYACGLSRTLTNYNTLDPNTAAVANAISNACDKPALVNNGGIAESIFNMVVAVQAAIPICTIGTNPRPEHCDASVAAFKGKTCVATCSTNWCWSDCEEDACQSTCTSLGCVAFCRGTGCVATCDGASCTAACHGAECRAVANGRSSNAFCDDGADQSRACSATAAGDEATASCRGPQCRAELTSGARGRVGCQSSTDVGCTAVAPQAPGTYASCDGTGCAVSGGGDQSYVRCAGQGCRANSTGAGGGTVYCEGAQCSAAIEGANSQAFCEDAGCTAVCSDSGCTSACNGDGCSALCHADGSCTRLCQGAPCMNTQPSYTGTTDLGSAPTDISDSSSSDDGSVAVGTISSDLGVSMTDAGSTPRATDSSFDDGFTTDASSTLSTTPEDSASSDIPIADDVSVFDSASSWATTTAYSNSSGALTTMQNNTIVASSTTSFP